MFVHLSLIFLYLTGCLATFASLTGESEKPSVATVGNKRAAAKEKGDHHHHQLLLLSFDGFRWDYLSEDFKNKFHLSLPNFDKLKRIGVTSPEGNIPPHYTQTFPSHYTTATGLYIENHGIVGNNFYDPKLNDTFDKKKSNANDAQWWDQGEPIWITAKKQKLRSATLFWPGSEVNFHGIKPDIQMAYNISMPFDLRVKTVVGWLEDGIDLVVSYFHQPDQNGHHFGPDSPQVAVAVKQMDKIIGEVMDAISRSDQLRGKVNVLLTSDHGMYPVSKAKTLSLYGHLKRSDADIPLDGPVIHVIPKKLSIDNTLKILSTVSPHIHFFRHSAIPSAFHYRDNDRIPPIVGFADLGWQGVKRVEDIRWWAKGRHGWSNRHPEMRPIFFAFGPAFKRGFSSASFETVNYYPLMCHLLKIEPAPNNGTLSNVRHLLERGSIW